MNEFKAFDDEEFVREFGARLYEVEAMMYKRDKLMKRLRLISLGLALIIIVGIALL